MPYRRDQRPVTNEDRQRVRELHALGMGRNAIAREINRAQRTVSILAAEMGLVFDTSMTEDATRARVAQLAALRADTALDLHLDALKLTQQMWEPSIVFSFGGKENTYNEREVEEPPAVEKKNLMAAAGIALEKSLKLVPPAEADGAEEVGSLLTSLFDKLRDRHGDG